MAGSGDVNSLLLRSAMGLTGGSVTSFYKFGYNAAVSSTEETVWMQGGRYVWPTSASTMTISSADANDTSAGTGAQTVTINGLDANYAEISETVTMDGQTAATTTNSYLRVHRAIVDTAGTTGSNEGVVYVGTGTVTAGVPANVYTTIAAGEGQTLQCFYTVPAGKKALLLGVYASSFSNNAVYVTCRIRMRPQGGAWNTKDRFTVTRSAIEISHPDAPSIDEKTDIDFTGESSGTDADLSAVILMLLFNKPAS